MRLLPALGIALVAVTPLPAQTTEGGSRLRWDTFAGVGILEGAVGPALALRAGVPIVRFVTAAAELGGTVSGRRHLEAGLATVTLHGRDAAGAWIRSGVGLLNRPLDCIETARSSCNGRIQGGSMLNTGFALAAGFSRDVARSWRLGPSISYVRVFVDDTDNAAPSTWFLGLQLSRR